MRQKQKRKSTILFIVALLAVAAMILINIFGVTIKGMEKGSARNIVLGLDLKGGVSVTYQAKGDYTTEDFNDTIRKLRLRAQEFSSEADVYQEGDDRITVDIPGEDDAEEVLEMLGKPGALSFVTDDSKVWSVGDTVDFESESVTTWLTGADISSAKPATDNSSSTGMTEYVVAFELTSEATTVFAEATEKYLNKPIYVVYDGQVISAPRVSTKITGGSGEINGMDSYEEAEELASIIRIGSLKVELEDISSKVVSAKLGDNALQSSLIAGGIGILIVIAFMICVYRIQGLAAGIALIAYTALDLLCINGFNWTLTLPGVAGVILSIGMAVDANVIVFARVKEELYVSDNVENAIKTGFKKATSAIVDGNITTLIASIVLMVVGTGTVRGFAQTLALGIVLSMFTAMVVSRVLITLIYRMGFDKKSMYGVQKERKTFDFLGKKVICFVISGIIILAGVAGMILSKTGAIGDRENILNYSVEFQGGLSTTVDFKENYDIAYFNENILPDIQEAIGDTDVVANAETDSNRYVIRTKDLEKEQKEALKTMLVEKHGADAEGFDEVTVSASTSSEMRRGAIIAVAVATVFMLIYIFIRFRDIKFATSAVIALIHDVMIVLSFYVLTWATVGNTFIACMLTLVGYSINATIVIFDRIRENLTVMSGADRRVIVNKSITETLTRSIYTSFTTFIMVFMIYILGVTAIKEFALPLMIGIVFGGYSSVFITGALWYIMGGKKQKAYKAQ